MIPKKSTPIKNEILIEILAKGLLNKEEIRIMAYIIRWSWGFNGVRRRQDWTKELKKRKIAEDIGMAESNFNDTINKMIKENKITVKDKCYQFNEHPDSWKLIEKISFEKTKLIEKISKTYLKNKFSDKKLIEKISSTGENSIQDKALLDRKETKDKENKEKLFFSFINKKFVNIKLYINNFLEGYPNTDVYLEIENMEGWLMAEYEKKEAGKKSKIPKDYNLFVHKWLRRNEVSKNEKF